MKSYPATSSMLREKSYHKEFPLLPKLTWPQVALFLGMFFIATVGACVLLAMDKDVSALLSLVALIAVPVLTAAGAAAYQKLDHIKQISNGNLTRMMDMVQTTQDQVARLALKLPAETDPDVLKPISPAPLMDDAPTATLWPPR